MYIKIKTGYSSLKINLKIKKCKEIYKEGKIKKNNRIYKERKTMKNKEIYKERKITRIYKERKIKKNQSKIINTKMNKEKMNEK